jgi:hypothetical protein
MILQRQYQTVKPFPEAIMWENAKSADSTIDFSVTDRFVKNIRKHI